jgi:fumarate hydratase class I/fumarate hydratase subunit beta
MEGPVRVDLPASRETLSGLSAGDEVRLHGVVYAARDATHQRLLEALAGDGVLPHGLEGATLFYAGPSPPAAGRPAGAVGPTTAKRMDKATPALLEAGIGATIGKGPRSEPVRRACARHGAVYFAAVGGIAALLATKVVASEPVAYEELGPEALTRLTLEDFPAFVAIDASGGDLFARVRESAGGGADARA